MEWYLKVLQNYVGFSGRARRKEYWMFLLIHLVIVFALAFVETMVGLGGEDGYGLISGLYVLAVILPSVAVGFRRLHDTGKSGWWCLISFIPLIGALILLFFLASDGDAGDNQYGPDPKVLVA